MTTWANRIIGHGTEEPDQLLANPRNWRIHPKAQQDALSGLLDTVGWVQDVIVNQRTGHVVDGHLRVSLAISRQEPTIPVVYVDLAPEEEALVLASLDPLAAMAVTDAEMLAELMADVSVEGALADMLGDLVKAGPKPGNTNPDAIPEPPALVSKPGDSTDVGCVGVLMQGQSAAAMWTDPPYGVSYEGKTAESLRIANDGADGLAALLAGFLAGAWHAVEGGAPFYIARPAGALSITFGKAIDGAGWKLHEELQWVKDAMVLGHSDYHLKHETIMYGWLPGEGRSGRGKHEGSRWYGDNAQVSVFEIPRPKASREHPTSKPVELIERCLENSSRVGDIIYEPFSGSGSTLIACERLGRKCYAMEIEPRYVDVAVKRWEEYTGRKAVLDG